MYLSVSHMNLFTLNQRLHIHTLFVHKFETTITIIKIIQSTLIISIHSKLSKQFFSLLKIIICKLICNLNKCH
jgi:hypothetical protein